MTAWDKVTSKSLAKKLGVREEDLQKMAVERLRGVLNRASPERLDEIRKMELELLRGRNARHRTDA
jgi:hypothetical protein